MAKLTLSQIDERRFIENTVQRVKNAPGQTCVVPLLKQGKMPFSKFENLLKVKAGIVAKIEPNGIRLAIPKQGG